ncbi:hypothetical protein Q4029_09755 [Acinetobacter baumannii]|uniref:Uncharacterized protein n=1 Tax=Acinetobacter baumannii TaxID=470 RepID=A0A1S2G1P0_ACIBA|nr:hypothetical protein [Acinetobacter baumannii]MCE6436525.1 hypothetical protein [Acinetobacter baumannii]MCE6824079.1 hypothetical protein [Acinetobacter baumannii]MCE6827822.1 hypothetical protein [Acinetobacter baumannii]MCE6850384.1 hypothetical protein [Acinetobacter baumannii]OIE32445.1 hypothetical protein A7L66_08215 [Acinetobacter baumannii]
MSVEFTYLYETDKKDSLPILALVTLDSEGFFKTLSSTNGKLFKIIGTDRIVIEGKEYIWRESSVYKRKPLK